MGIVLSYVIVFVISVAVPVVSRAGLLVWLGSSIIVVVGEDTELVSDTVVFVVTSKKRINMATGSFMF